MATPANPDVIPRAPITKAAPRAMSNTSKVKMVALLVSWSLANIAQTPFPRTFFCGSFLPGGRYGVGRVAAPMRLGGRQVAVPRSHAVSSLPGDGLQLTPPAAAAHHLNRLSLPMFGASKCCELRRTP